MPTPEWLSMSVDQQTAVVNAMIREGSMFAAVASRFGTSERTIYRRFSGYDQMVARETVREKARTAQDLIKQLGRLAARKNRDAVSTIRKVKAIYELAREFPPSRQQFETLKVLAAMWANSGGKTFADFDLEIEPENVSMTYRPAMPVMSVTGSPAAMCAGL